MTISDEDMPSSGHVVTVTAALAGRTLADVVRKQMQDVSWNEARELCRRGKVTRGGEVATDAAQRVALGDVIAINKNAPRLRENVLDEALIVHLDRDVVIVNKPIGVMSVPFDDDDKNTLIDRVRMLLKRKTGHAGTELGAVQRLDKDTSGLIVFTRNLEAKRKLQQLFRVHDIERSYVAIAHGKVQSATCETMFVQDRGDGLRGSYGVFRRPKGPPPREAQRALTHLHALEALRGATLVECRLETGRQHQIRIHLSERGHPIVGEAVYVRDFSGPVIRAARPMLHAQTLGFAHPRSGEALRFSQPPPRDFEEMLESLRAR